MKFLKQVAESTGATVHGSDGKVGSAERGGSWELSRHAAPRPPFSGEAVSSFKGTLWLPRSREQSRATGPSTGV